MPQLTNQFSVSYLFHFIEKSEIQTKKHIYISRKYLKELEELLNLKIGKRNKIKINSFHQHLWMETLAINIQKFMRMQNNWHGSDTVQKRKKQERQNEKISFRQQKCSASENSSHQPTASPRSSYYPSRPEFKSKIQSRFFVLFHSYFFIV